MRGEDAYRFQQHMWGRGIAYDPNQHAVSPNDLQKFSKSEQKSIRRVQKAQAKAEKKAEKAAKKASGNTNTAKLARIMGRGSTGGAIGVGTGPDLSGLFKLMGILIVVAFVVGIIMSLF